MQRTLAGVLILILGLSVAAGEREGPDQPATPAEQYKAILKEFQVASSGLLSPTSGWAAPATRPSTRSWTS